MRRSRPSAFVRRTALQLQRATFPYSSSLFNVFHKTTSRLPHDWYFALKGWRRMNISCNKCFRFRMCRPISGCRRVAMRISLESFPRIRTRYNTRPNLRDDPRALSMLSINPGLPKASTQLNSFPLRAPLFIPPSVLKVTFSISSN